MNVVIVYDSQYGNTQELAHTIAHSLSHYEAVHVLPVRRAGEIDWDHVNLVVVGGPTHEHGMTVSIRDWLDSLPPQRLVGIHAVAFDTRYHLPRLLSGSAATEIAKRHKKLGAEMLLPPESFYVAGEAGPLADGELERAERWALLTPAGVEA